MHRTSRWTEITLLTGLCTGLVAASAPAVAELFPGAPIDQRTQRVQGQVEELYGEAEYERALLIYEEELAPNGDKYAQYMVGYMTLTGRGVEEDPAKALAWYRLAAERGDNPYVEARDALAATLGDEALERADALYAGLRARLGDRRLLLELLEEDLETLSRYDERPPDRAEAGTALASGFVGGNARLAAYNRIRERMRDRLEYLDAATERPQAGDDNGQLREFERRVRERIAALPDY